MKYVKKIPKTDRDLSISLVNEGWKKIKDPSSLITAILFSVPFMVITGAITYLIISRFTDVFSDTVKRIIESGSFNLPIRLDYILYFYLLIWIHELIHAGLIPDFIKSKNTYFGIRPWGGFVYTADKISKERFLLICVGPFLLISVILPIVLGGFGLLNMVLIFIILLNAIASSVDILNAFLILFQVPSGSYIKSNGFESYYIKKNNDSFKDLA